MDSSITAAGRALRVGDPLGALKRIALRDDPAALALRGIAMAQLGDLKRAQELLRRAGRAFGPRETLARARCLTAEAEVALAARDLASPARALGEALRTFAAHGDQENATHARLLQIRRLLLLGRLDEADGARATLDRPRPRPRPAGGHRRSRQLRDRASPGSGQAGRGRARAGTGGGGTIGHRCPARRGRAGGTHTGPAGRARGDRGTARSVTMAEVEAMLASTDLIVDGCRRAARRGARVVQLARRPVLFALLSGLAEAWPDSAPRDGLIGRAFGVRRANESHRVRLRVEVGRLRHELRPLAQLDATADGFVLVPRGPGTTVCLLIPPIESPDAAVLALLADGEAWSTSALAMALASSQRTAQRALVALEAAGQVRTLGHGRSQRWLSAPVAGFATTLLLPTADQFG